MVAVPMLGFAGSTIGNRLHLILKNSYREFPTLYLAIIAPPGSAKTPALNLAQWPLDALQNEAEQIYRERQARYDDDLDAWRQSKNGERPSKPQLRDYFSSNLTLEALIAMFDRAPGVAIIRDEILGWVSSMDQYRGGKGSDRQEYLSLWSAKTIKLDRKGADPIYRRFPVACVVGGIQPDLVAGLHHEAQKRDGFVERLLPIVPDVAPMPWTEETVSPGRYTDVVAVYRALDALNAADLDVEGTAVGVGVALSAEARRLYVEWFNENQTLVVKAHGLAAGFYSKLPAHVARLALILHALWNPDDPRVMISGERMQDAIEVGEFFRAHISRFLALLQATAPTQFAGLSARIVRILRILPMDRGDVADGWVTRSDLLHGLGNVKTDELTTALDGLHAAGTIERRTRSTATKPVEEWRLTPVFENSDDWKYSNNSNYSTSGPVQDPNNGGNFESCEYFESPNGHLQSPIDADYEEVLL
jgi:hypothetical protein